MKYIIFFLILFLINSKIQAETHILFLGDSLAEGLGVDENQAFPKLVERNLRLKKKEVVVTNGGVSGATSASGEGRLRWHLKKKTDVVILELGANDGLRGLKISETENNLRKIIQFAKNQKVKIILAEIQMPPNYGIKYTSEFKQMYLHLSQTEKILLMPFFLKNVAGISKYNQADGIHPNVQGHEIIAKDITNFLEKIL